MFRDTDAPCGLEPFLRRVAVNSAVELSDIEALSRLPHQVVTLDGLILPSDQITPDSIFMVGAGLVSQSCQLHYGELQTVGLSFAGDIARFSIGLGFTATNMRLQAYAASFSVISCSDLLEVGRAHPRLLEIFLKDAANETCRAHEWLVNIGARRAVARMAYFFLEMAERIVPAGAKDCYHLPLTQNDLATILGLSLVHTNKSYQILRRAEVVTFEKHKLTILDLDGLRLHAGLSKVPSAQKAA